MRRAITPQYGGGISVKTNQRLLKLLMPSAVLALLFLVVPAATADAWNKETHVRFGEPVEFPGGVVVPAGGYVMKLADSLSNRHIVQVMNPDQNHIYATVLATPTYRSEPAEKTIITFYETPRGDPQHIAKWYYPGDTIGQEFPYSRGRTHHNVARATSLSGPAAYTEPESGAPTEVASAQAQPAETKTVQSEERPQVESSPVASEPQAEPSPNPTAAQQSQGGAEREASSRRPARICRRRPASCLMLSSPVVCSF